MNSIVLYNIEDVYCLSTHTLSKVSFLKVSETKFSPKVSKWSQWSFLRISENDTFESVILESLKIESVRVDRHPHFQIFSEMTSIGTILTLLVKILILTLSRMTLLKVYE